MAKYLDNKLVLMKEIGKDGNWLHKWISDKPERLGIEPFEIIAQELHQLTCSTTRLVVEQVQ
ncbi:MAG: hypothetical protein LBH18_01270 [Spirochaetaceae bacterium]|nr:hypothetical protein [Spirochaetaceae bacterium]